MSSLYVAGGRQASRIIPFGLDALGAIQRRGSILGASSGPTMSAIPRPFAPGASLEALDLLAANSAARSSLPEVSKTNIDRIKEARKQVDSFYGTGKEFRNIPVNPNLPYYPASGTQRKALLGFEDTGALNYRTMKETGVYDPKYSTNFGLNLPANINLKSGDSLTVQLNAINKNPQIRQQTVSDMADNVVESFNRAFAEAKQANPSLTTKQFADNWAKFYQDKGSSAYMATGIYEPGLVNAMAAPFSGASSPADELGSLVQFLIDPRSFPRSAKGADSYNKAVRALISKDPLSFFNTSAVGARVKVPSYGRTSEAAAQEALNRVAMVGDNVVADRHAADLALGMKGAYESAGLGDIKRYGIFEDAFSEAAKRLGIRPSDVQDVTWHWWRDATLSQPKRALPPIGKMTGDLLGQAGGRGRIDPIFRAPLEQRREILAAYRGLSPDETSAAVKSISDYDELIRSAREGLLG